MVKEVALSLVFNVEEVKLMKGKRLLLRVFIDKPGGVTVNDCEVMSRDLEAVLDLEDIIKEPYTLEVSSPGLDRPLKNPDDFRKHMGKLIRLVTKRMLNNQSFFIGTIVYVCEDYVRLQVGEKQIDIFFDNISSARLEIKA